MRVGLRGTLIIAIFAVICATWADETANDLEDPALRSTFERTCSQCHPSSKAVPGSRPGEEWPAVVKRMQSHAQGTEKAFDDRVASAVTAFLATSVAEPDHGHSGEQTEAHGELGRFGGALGIVTAVLIATMVTAGALRRKIGRRFRRLHAFGAVLLVCALAAHAAILYLDHGPPDSLWHLCGTGAFVLVAVTASLGLARRRIGRKFVRIHACAALLTAVLALLHRLLA